MINKIINMHLLVFLLFSFYPLAAQTSFGGFVIKIVDKNKENSRSKNSSTTMYVLNNKKDSVYYYFNTSKNSFKLPEPILYMFFKSGDTLSLRSKSSYETNLSLIFDDKKKAIVINSHDCFYLNEDYYSFLNKVVNENLDITELSDFLEYFLPEYNLENLKYLISKSKYQNPKFRILKGYMETNRSQASDYIDKWNITFDYDKEGYLSYISKKSIEEDNGFERKLVSKKNGVFKYKLYRNNESRLISDGEEVFNVTNNSVFSLKTNVEQISLGVEKTYEINRNSYLKKNIKKFPLSKNELNVLMMK